MAETSITSGESEFISLLEANQGIVHKVCRLYAQSAEERRDLFQDITMQLWRAWPNFRRGSKPSTWMYRIALNVAISGLRRQRVPTETLSEAQHHLPAPEAGPPDDVTRLYAALDNLSPVEKSLALLMLEDHSYEEMAQITGLTTDHLRVKTHRIREKLRTLIQRQTTL